MVKGYIRGTSIPGSEEHQTLNIWCSSGRQTICVIQKCRFQTQIAQIFVHALHVSFHSI